MVYLTCATTMNVTGTANVTLGGTAKKAFSCATTLTVKPVAKGK